MNNPQLFGFGRFVARNPGADQNAPSRPKTARFNNPRGIRPARKAKSDLGNIR